MNVLQKFRSVSKNEFYEKELIVERLLEQGVISAKEAVVLLKTVDIHLEVENLNISSGGKILGGSDFSTVDFGRF